MLFPYNVLSLPSKNSNKKVSLSTAIKSNLKTFDNKDHHLNFSDQQNTNFSVRKNINLSNNIKIKHVINKFSDGDLTSAIKILTSDDSFADVSAATLTDLKSKLPLEKLNSMFPTLSSEPVPILITEEFVSNAVNSFKTSSAGGLDSLKPSHLQDLISSSAGPSGKNILSSLCKLYNFILNDTVNINICHFIRSVTIRFN